MIKLPLVFLVPLIFSADIHAEDKAQIGSSTNQVSAHILDIHKGYPAEGVTVDLYKSMDAMHTNWEKVETHQTNSNGYIGNFLPKMNRDGVYKLVFHTGDYQKKQGVLSMYPYIEVAINVRGSKHYHIPLLLSGNGFSPMVLTR
jgi:5-hydroxyisourate hydrolase